MEIRDYTTIEQSKKLLELGLSRDTANMIYPCSIVRGKENGFLNAISKESILYAMHTTIEEKEKSIPCWSLGALLELIPHDGMHGIELNNYNDGKTIWTALFSHKSEFYTIIRPKDIAVDAVFEIVVWLLENGYIKKV